MTLWCVIFILVGRNLRYIINISFSNLSKRISTEDVHVGLVEMVGCEEGNYGYLGPTWH